MPAHPDFISTQVSASRRYYLDLNPAPTKGITVVCGGCEHCRPDYLVNRNSFPFYGLEFVAQGEGLLVLKGRPHQLRPGLLFAYGPGVPHRIRNDQPVPLVKYYVDFVGERARRLLAEGPLAHGQAAQVSDANQVYELFELLQRNGAEQSPLSGRLCATLLEVLLLTIAEKARANVPEDPRALSSYQRCKRHLEQHFATIKTLEDAARDLHVNVSYLCRLFQRFDHGSPYQYLLRLKMNRAAGLLLDAGLRVKEVAAALHFADPYNFSRAFKKVYGLAPEHFLKRSQRHAT